MKYRKTVGEEVTEYNGRYITTETGVIVNPTEDQLLANGWEAYEDPEPDEPEPTIEEVKEQKSAEIEEYDNSDSVNSFTYNGMSLWLDFATRSRLRVRLDAEEQAGLTETKAWYNGMPIVLDIQQAKQMLYTLEVYASKCWDTTAQHRLNVQSLTTIEEVEAYDYTTGYPEKIAF